MQPTKIRKVVQAEVNPSTLRLTGKTQIVTANAENNPGWVTLNPSTAVMVLNGTKAFADYALINGHVVEVPGDIDLAFLTHISPLAWPEITTIDHKWTNIPWLPLDVPRIEPDNWDLFWQLWNEKSGIIGRAAKQEDQMWKGLTIWTRPDVDTTKFNYAAENYEDWSLHFPQMFEQIKNCVPWLALEKVVLWSNVNAIQPHFDPDYVIFPWPDSLRIMLWDTNEAPTFYMNKWPKRSEEFNPPPVTVRSGGTGYGLGTITIPQEQRMYVNLPKDTNAFVFNNGAFLHGADLAKPKIIMAVKGRPNIYKWLRTLEASYEKYKDYIPKTLE